LGGRCEEGKGKKGGWGGHFQNRTPTAYGFKQKIDGREGGTKKVGLLSINWGRGTGETAGDQKKKGVRDRKWGVLCVESVHLFHDKGTFPKMKMRGMGELLTNEAKSLGQDLRQENRQDSREKTGVDAPPYEKEVITPQTI